MRGPCAATPCCGCVFRPSCDSLREARGASRAVPALEAYSWSLGSSFPATQTATQESRRADLGRELRVVNAPHLRPPQCPRSGAETAILPSGHSPPWLPQGDSARVAATSAPAHPPARPANRRQTASPCLMAN